jgi:hypothetical protein
MHNVHLDHREGDGLKFGYLADHYGYVQQSLNVPHHATLLDTTTATTSSFTLTEPKIKDSDDDYIDAILFNPSEDRRE